MTEVLEVQCCSTKIYVTWHSYLKKDITQIQENFWVLTKNLAEIGPSLTISEINVFLHFTQKFNMPAKNYWENDFLEKNMIFHISYWQKFQPKLLYLTLF